jgi:diguanylate cyclase (GGDEF)-like protein
MSGTSFANSVARKGYVRRVLSHLWRRPALREGVILAAIALSLFLVTDWGFVFDSVVEFARNNADWRVENMLVVALMSSVLVVIYAVRRVRDLKTEVKARQVAEREAHALARHDPLTGLPNRRFFSEKLDELLGLVTQGARRSAVLFLDLDGFKPINDIYGHVAGDQALIEFAVRVTAGLEPGALLARLGGDEFAIMLPNVQSLHDCTRSARRALRAAAEPFAIGGTAVTLGVSVGIAVAPDDGVHAGDLVRRADLALYRAKADGRSLIRFFEPQMDALMEKRLHIERELRRALAAREIVPHYQPLISFDEYKLIGFEALARWDGRDLGSISPVDFIPIAEECGLISELEDQVLHHACRDAASWPDELKVAVNISATQLRDESFGRRMMSILAETGLNPRRLELELTETAIVENLERAKRVIEELRSAGIQVALDDFGTGHATIGQLRALNLDKIKIDRSFVERLLNDEDSLVIVKAILGLAGGFGLSAVAEGIETREQLACLKANGCLQGQGHLFGKAVPASEVGTVLRAFSPRALPSLPLHRCTSGTVERQFVASTALSNSNGMKSVNDIEIRSL